MEKIAVEVVTLASLNKSLSSIFEGDVINITANATDNLELSFGQIIVNDTDHVYGIGGDRIWAWKSFMRGLHPIFMDPYTETTDDFIADFSVGIGADYVKFGAPARGERVAKYNRLSQIEDEIVPV